MRCEELRRYFEDHLRDAENRCGHGTVAEHAATCSDCNRFLAEQRELGRSLREIRESVGSVPQSLDHSALSSYRNYLAGQTSRQAVMDGMFHSRLAWRFAGLAAGILIVAGVLLFWREPTINTTVKARTPPSDTASLKEATPRPVPHGPKARTAKAAKGQETWPASSARAATLPVRSPGSLPEGFRSLMYCDELSCPQDMAMIRVQLPPSAVPRQVSGFIQTSGSVTADVLVGPDGIARGIRVEEIEF